MKIEGQCRRGKFYWRVYDWTEYSVPPALILGAGYCWKCGYRLAPDGFAYPMMVRRDAITEQIERILQCVREGREVEAARLEKKIHNATR